MDPEVILYLFHHVFLPGKLPQQDDYNPAYEIVLLDKVIEALSQFKNRVSVHSLDCCSTVVTMLTRLRENYNNHGGVDKVELTKALMDLSREGGFLPIYIRAQNAGILMQKKGEAIYFESFELSRLYNPF